MSAGLAGTTCAALCPMTPKSSPAFALPSDRSPGARSNSLLDRGPRPKAICPSTWLSRGVLASGTRSARSCRSAVTVSGAPVPDGARFATSPLVEFDHSADVVGRRERAQPGNRERDTLSALNRFRPRGSQLAVRTSRELPSLTSCSSAAPAHRPARRHRCASSPRECSRIAQRRRTATSEP